MKEIISKKLKELRKQSGLKQKDVAFQNAIGYEAYKNYERELATPPLETLVRLAAFYRVTIDEIIKE